MEPDPEAWEVANRFTLSLQPRRLVHELVFGALAIIVAGQVEEWEHYLQRVILVTHPTLH
jgi:hypothetical protein